MSVNYFRLRSGPLSKGCSVKITKVIAREIFDSQCMPTVECQIILEDGCSVTHSVPTGISKSPFESKEMRDSNRFFGFGVLKAIEQIDVSIAPALIGKEPDLVSTDLYMLELDGTENMQKLGANTTLAVSGAVAKAQALVNQIELFELFAHLCDFEAVTIPFPMFNAIEGGVHAPFNNLAFQEFLVIPVGQRSYRACLEATVLFFHNLKQLLFKDGPTFLGPEGGFAPLLNDERQAFDYLMEARDLSKVDKDTDFVFALDVAAGQFYDSKQKLYIYNNIAHSPVQMIALYDELSRQYPIYSIEDGLSQEDELHWQQMEQHFNGGIRLVGDDLYASNVDRIARAIEMDFADMIVIKPNQVGTLTQALQAIKLCKEHELALVVSHRSHETEDVLIADLAVGVSAQHIKAGGLFHSERMSKYLRLLRIEDSLMLSLLN